MSRDQRNCLGFECINYNASRDEEPLSSSCDDSYCTDTGCLPSWREFAEGVPVFSQSCGYHRSITSEGSSFEKNLSIPLEYPYLLFRSQLNVSSQNFPISQQCSFQYDHFMASVSSGNVSTLRLVDVVDLTTLPQKFLPTLKVAQKCKICGRGIARDLARHIRTHDKESRFKCFYPRASCHHKSGYFNRMYDFKKHLLHRHFVLRDSSVRRLRNLTAKLEHEGTCPCGKRMKAREWLIHIIRRDTNGSLECEDLRKKTAKHT